MPGYPYLGRPETGQRGIDLRAAALHIERAYSDPFLGRLMDASGRNRTRKPTQREWEGELLYEIKFFFFFSIIKRDGVCEHDFEKGKGKSRRCWKGKHDQNTLHACMTFSKNIFKIIKNKKKVTPTPAQLLGTLDSEQEDTDCSLQFYGG